MEMMMCKNKVCLFQTSQTDPYLDQSMKQVINHQHYASVHDIACTTGMVTIWFESELASFNE